jgi:hypothetical protein
MRSIKDADDSPRLQHSFSTSWYKNECSGRVAFEEPPKGSAKRKISTFVFFQVWLPYYIGFGIGNRRRLASVLSRAAVELNG